MHSPFHSDRQQRNKNLPLSFRLTAGNGVLSTVPKSLLFSTFKPIIHMQVMHIAAVCSVLQCTLVTGKEYMVGC